MIKNAIEKLGGIAHLEEYIAAYDFYQDENVFSFKFSASDEFNCCRLSLNHKDLYDMSFIAFNDDYADFLGEIDRRAEKPEGVTFSDLVALKEKRATLKEFIVRDIVMEELVITFTGTTGLYLS